MQAVLDQVALEAKLLASGEALAAILVVVVGLYFGFQLIKKGMLWGRLIAADAIAQADGGEWDAEAQAWVVFDEGLNETLIFDRQRLVWE